MYLFKSFIQNFILKDTFAIYWYNFPIFSSLPTEGSTTLCTFLQSCLLGVSPWDSQTCSAMGGHISIW